MNNIIVEREGMDPISIHLPEVAAIVASHKRVVFTQSVLAGVAGNNGIVVVCDDKFMPVGMMLPLRGNSLQSEKFAQQAAAALPVKKRIWRQLVIAKVRAQGRLLKELNGDDSGLMAMAKKVKSGDSTNVEAQAARRYWVSLFGDDIFHRHRDGEDQNRFLNYGYSVLRAIVTRAICATGLHPALGVHHHNRYDTFCLSDDIIEPFRPIVDRAVHHVVKERGADAPMDQALRYALIRPLYDKYSVSGESRTLFDALTRTSASLAEVFAGNKTKILLPEI
ncbi:type II CRISPR-associated endonuclease Cas1 [bacterium]|nr:type II CRISPR-associated endonuclease Cas1 [bacterium]MBU1674726.1 type II CRISPR-associated endonuclease Cas1 [bacterium]